MSLPSLSLPSPLQANNSPAPGAAQRQTRLRAAAIPTAEAVTRAASTQTYFTIRCLADRPFMADAYRAYAYFRWLDDALDQTLPTPADRLAFLARQKAIIDHCYRGGWPGSLSPEERWIIRLIRHDQKENSGLGLYINQMMAVMAFDARRKDRLISEAELAAYTRALATAVTEALHYFIGHNHPSPQGEGRYQAVTGAHITHMLRDTIEDTAVGYYNISREYLEAHGLAPTDVYHPAYQAWVCHRVQAARRCFHAGRMAMAQVQNRRCRLAGHAYIARFEVVLDAIEKDGCRLRPDYPERKSKRAGLKMGLSALSQTFLASQRSASQTLPATEVNR